MPHTSVRPRRHTNYSTELMVNVRGVHGHQGYCSCGWEGRTWDRQPKALAEAKWHFYDAHGEAAQPKPYGQRMAEGLDELRRMPSKTVKDREARAAALAAHLRSEDVTPTGSAEAS